MRTQRFATAQENEEFRLAPAPPDILQPVSVAESFGMQSGRSRARNGRSRALESDPNDQFRLSPVPEDEEPPVAVAQGFTGRARQMAVIEIASAIAGAAMTRILDNDGDVKWELDQLNGVAHPDNKTSSPTN